MLSICIYARLADVSIKDLDGCLSGMYEGIVTIQLLLKSENKSLRSGISGGNVGGRDADSSLHGCIDGILRKIYPIAVTFSHVLNSYRGF